MNDVRYKQHAVIQLFVAEKESVRNIHRRLSNVYGIAAVDRSTTGHWAKRATASETGKAEPHDLPHSGRPVTAVHPEMLQHADAIVHEDHHITTQQLALRLSISKGSVCRIIQDLVYLKVCERCVPQSRTVEQKTKQKALSSELLAHFEAQGDLIPDCYSRCNLVPSF
jgi:hypothetical protein